MMADEIPMIVTPMIVGRDFFAWELPKEARNPKVNRPALSKAVITWLSKNLRKRPTDKGKRYKYIRSRDSLKSFATGKQPKAHIIGVRIRSKEDAMAFKLRWT